MFSLKIESHEATRRYIRVMQLCLQIVGKHDWSELGGCRVAGSKVIVSKLHEIILISILLKSSRKFTAAIGINNNKLFMRINERISSEKAKGLTMMLALARRINNFVCFLTFL